MVGIECCPAQTAHKPVETSSVKQAAGDRSLLFQCIYYSARGSKLLMNYNLAA